MNESRNTEAPEALPARPQKRKPYSPPTLTVFGHVAALTQGSNCSASNDGNGSCPSSGGTDMGKLSDRRAKEGIVRIGDHPLGFGLYLFSYASEPGRRHFGVMADEVAAVMPEAIVPRADGLLTVRYDLLGIRPAMH